MKKTILRLGPFAAPLRALSIALLLSLVGPTLSACKSTPKTPEESWTQLRDRAQGTKKASTATEWALAELLRPGGDPEKARRARKQLDELGVEGVPANLARAIADLGHGKSQRAADEFFKALIQAKSWEDPRASLYAWYAARKVDQLLGLSPDFGARHRDEIAALLKTPGHIGFRAYATVVELWAKDAFKEAKAGVDEKLAHQLGCVQNINLAGPFGANPATDIVRKFDAERAGVWPERWETEPGHVAPPRRLKTTQVGCDVIVDEAVTPGIFYGETFITVKEPVEVIVTAGGATELWVNDALALHRDIRVWGIWPKFGARIHLSAGRHRFVWKFGDASTALRIVELSGKRAEITSSRESRLGYSLVPPSLGPDPNDLMAYIRPDGVVDPGDDLTRYVAAGLAHQEGQPDVATVLFEPLVKDPETATGISLSAAAAFAEDDPIYDETQTRDLVHELELRAAERDPGLWYPKFKNLIWEAQQKGPTTVLEPLEALQGKFKEVSAIPFALAQVYSNLGWGPEHERTVKALVEKFPSDTDALSEGIDLYGKEGDEEKERELLDRLRKLNPDSEVFFFRALAAKDYQTALQELRRLGARRPSRKDIQPRIEQLLIQSGDKERTLEHLRAAIEREPRDVLARLAVADARLARGDENPLTAALVEAVEAGVDPGVIEGAIDLVEGLTALEPFRLDGKKVIAEYEAKGNHLSGTAARVLDYGAVWVRGDGSSRFLEHEIVRIQSEEAIKRFAETDTHGLILRLRVVKKDGRTLEPEAVAGKPTATMPHLEVGDYVETERIISQWGDGARLRYSGPGWFFRELNVAYSRSEFVVVAPKDKPLVLEAHNGVVDPEVSHTDSLVIHRYRVDDSPAAPAEPNSPPEQEFLPSVSIGWGQNFNERLTEMNRAMVSVTANDPRLVRIAKNIVKDLRDSEAQLRALYHWTLDSVQEGEEGDGRRVVVSRNGNRWRGFQTLVSALGFEARWALAESRLSSPARGPLSDASRQLFPLLVVSTEKGRTFLTIDDQFAPFGTIPSHLRGEPVYILGGEEAETSVVPEGGQEDGIAYEGTGELKQDGSAVLDLRIVFQGTFAASLRNGLSQIPENQLGNIIESRLLGQYLQGARLKTFQVKNQNQLDQALVIAVTTEVPQFATPSTTGFLLSPPFMPRLTGLTPLAQRATPLLIRQESRQSLDLKLRLPKGVSARVENEKASSFLSSYEVKDTAQTGSLHLLRDVGSQAGRISVSEYADFQKYTNQADTALSRSLRLSR